MPQIIMDITSSASWAGPVVGIVRVETKLALWALANVDVVFVVFDPRRQCFRRVKSDWTPKLLDGRAALNTWDLPSADPTNPRRADRLSASFGTALRWLKIRRQFLAALEKVRLSNPALARHAARAQTWLMSTKHRRELFLPSGLRRDFPAFDTALGDEVSAGPDSVFVCAGLGWLNTSWVKLLDLQHRCGNRIVTFCFDIIPLQFPQWYKPHDVDAFRRYFHQAFPTSNLLVFSARQIERDAQDYCRSHSLPVQPSIVIPLASDFAARTGAPGTLPSQLVKGRYILFVSTIEPRKGHDLLYNAWLHLIAKGDDHDYKLVLVGRWGWNIAELKSSLLEDDRVKDRILIMSGVSDETLDALYRDCSFCVYPSLYEGFGLPVAEAFSYGKAVISSSSGALAEVVGDFSPTLASRDVDAWRDKLAQWIADPSERQFYEERIRTTYRPRSWSETASEFFGQALALASNRT